MINRQDCILLLTEMQNNGVDVKQQLLDVFNKSKMPEVLKFINDNRSLDLVNFYNKIRKSYNNKHSKLYINLVREEIDPATVITTLASFQLQILLFAKNLEDSKIFLRSSRINEVNAVINNYLQNWDLTEAMKLVTLIKADLKVSEWLDGKES